MGCVWRPAWRGGLSADGRALFKDYQQTGENKAKKDKFMAKEKEIS